MCPHTIDEILECRDLASAGRTILDAVSERMRARAGVAIEIHKGPGACLISAIARKNVPESIFQIYLENEHRFDPGIQVALDVSQRPRASGAMSLSYTLLTEHLSDRTFQELAFFNRFLKPAGVRHIAYVVFRPEYPARGLIGFGFHRGAEDRPFDASDLHQIADLRSAIAASLTSIFLRRRLSVLQSAIGQSVLDPEFNFGRAGLSLAQRTIASLAMQGLSNAAIAEHKGLSRRTVENHLRAVYVKLGINSRLQLILRAEAAVLRSKDNSCV